MFFPKRIAHTLKNFAVICLCVTAMAGSLAIISSPSAQAAGSASYTFSPASVSKNPNQTLTIVGSLNTNGVTATGGRSVVTYPTNLLQLSSYSVNSSACPYPHLNSNNAGTLDVEYGCNGVVGSAAVLTLNFATKAAGTATVRFASGSAAAGGDGQDIDPLSLGSTIITITNPVIVTPPATGGTTTPKTGTSTPKSSTTTKAPANSTGTSTTQPVTANPSATQSDSTTTEVVEPPKTTTKPVVAKKTEKTIFGIKIPTLVLPYTTRNIIINLAIAAFLLTVGSAILAVGFYQIYRYI